MNKPLEFHMSDVLLAMDKLSEDINTLFVRRGIYGKYDEVAVWCKSGRRYVALVGSDGLTEFTELEEVKK